MEERNVQMSDCQSDKGKEHKTRIGGRVRELCKAMVSLKEE